MVVKRMWWLAAAVVLAGCDASSPAASPPPAEAPVVSASPSAEAPVASTPPPADAACSDLIDAVAFGTGRQFRPGGGHTADGTRECDGTAGADAVRVLVHERRDADAPDALLAQAKTASGGCDQEISAPLDGVGAATSCRNGDTATSTLVLESGWVVVELKTSSGSAPDLAQKAAVAAVADF